MKSLFNKFGVFGLVIGGVVGAVITFGLLGTSSIFSQKEAPEALFEATVVVNAFHWGWVPQVVEPGPGARVEISPGAQGSRIIVPKNTNVTLVLRNAAGNTELHETFENRYRDFFMNKYGEAWMNMHQAGHDESMEEQELMRDEDEDMDGSENDNEDDSLLAHTFFLEGYGLSIELSPDPESNVQMVRFVTDKTGEFRFMCTNFCGLGHGDMNGTLVVE